MAAASKLRLSVLLLFLQLLFYLYVLPKGSGLNRQEDPGGGYLLDRACLLSYPPVDTSPSGRTFFLQLYNNCGIKIQKPPRPPPPPPIEVPPPEPSPPPEPPVQVRQPPPKIVAEVIKEPEEGNRSGNLIYQIIMVLLFLSVSFALADCFQERAKKRANPVFNIPFDFTYKWILNFNSAV